jgi:hypothetical protein
MNYQNNVQEKIRDFPKNKTLILIRGKEQIKPFIDYCTKKYGNNFYEDLKD